MAQIRVIGCGTPDAADDAVGLQVAERVRRRAAPGVEVIAVADPMRVVDLLTDVELVIVVDAIRSPGRDRAPGTLVRVDATSQPAEALRSSLSSHGLGLAEAVGLAAALGPVPRVIFHGVEIGDVTAGAPLSEPVAAALPALVRAVLDEASNA